MVSHGITEDVIIDFGIVFSCFEWISEHVSTYFLMPAPQNQEIEMITKVLLQKQVLSCPFPVFVAIVNSQAKNLKGCRSNTTDYICDFGK